jgi:hypothetical protein
VTSHVVGHEICLVSRVANPVRHSKVDMSVARPSLVPTFDDDSVVTVQPV